MKKTLLFLLAGGLFFACGQQPEQTTQNEINTIQTASMIPTSSKVATVESAAQEVWLPSLITATPQEGRALAITMARKTIGNIQTSAEVKKRLRGEYSEDPELLILSAQVVAIEYQTIAEANNYWRK